MTSPAGSIVTGGLLLLAWCLGCERRTTDVASQTVSAERGATLYQANGCAVCHGSQGRGDGPSAAALDPRPRDFREIRAYRRGATAAAIAVTLQRGFDDSRSRMPVYDHLSVADRRALADYVVRLQQ